MGVVLATVPGCLAVVRVVTWKTGVPAGFRDGFKPDHGSISCVLHLWIQLSIRILIVSQHDLYMMCAD